MLFFGHLYLLESVRKAFGYVYRIWYWNRRVQTARPSLRHWSASKTDHAGPRGVVKSSNFPRKSHGQLPGSAEKTVQTKHKPAFYLSLTVFRLIFAFFTANNIVRLLWTCSAQPVGSLALSCRYRPDVSLTVCLVLWGEQRKRELGEEGGGGIQTLSGCEAVLLV